MKMSQTLLPALWVMSSVALLVPFPVWAEDSSFAHCAQAEAETKQALEHIDATSRINAMSTLVTELASIKTEFDNKKSAQPKSYLKSCFDKKSNAFQNHILIAKAELQPMPDYWRLLGRYAIDIEGNVDKAYQAYATATKLDPKDYDSLVNTYTAWLKIKDTEFKNQKDHKTQSTIDKFFKDSNAMLKPILENEYVPKETKKQLLAIRAMLVNGTLASRSSAQFDFERILQLNPNDENALAQAASWSYGRSNWEDAHKYFDHLAELEPTNKEVQIKALELKVHFSEVPQVTKLAPQLVKRFPKESYFIAALAWAQYKNDKLEAAQATNAKALKLNAKSDLARSNQALLLEKEGDAYLEKKMTGAALSSYDKSYKFNDKNVSVRKKMSVLIFDYQKAQNFEPREVAQKDMDRLMDLLDPIFQKNNIDRVNVESYVFASVHSSTPKRGAKACLYYQETYVNFPNFDLVMTCARTLKMSGNQNQAEALLKQALQNPTFKAQRGELSKELRNAL